MSRTPFSNTPQWAQWSQRKWNIICSMVMYGETFYRRHTALTPAKNHDCKHKSQKGLPLEKKNSHSHENRRLGLTESLHMQHCSLQGCIQATNQRKAKQPVPNFQTKWSQCQTGPSKHSQKTTNRIYMDESIRPHKERTTSEPPP